VRPRSWRCATVLALALGGSPAVSAAPARTAAVASPTRSRGCFGATLFGELGVRHARYVVPWDAMDGGFQQEELTRWLQRRGRRA
jgi:hypothetical protein